MVPILGALVGYFFLMRRVRVLPACNSVFQSKNEPEGVGAGSFGRLLFGIFSYMSRGCRDRGNVGIGFIDFQGLWEGRKTALSFSGLSINRHFHGPLPLLRGVHADLLICSNMVFLACCIRRAASVSLMVAATAFERREAESGAQELLRPIE